MHDRHPASCCRTKITPLLQGVSFRCLLFHSGWFKWMSEQLGNTCIADCSSRELAVLPKAAISRAHTDAGHRKDLQRAVDTSEQAQRSTPRCSAALSGAGPVGPWLQQEGAASREAARSSGVKGQAAGYLQRPASAFFCAMSPQPQQQLPEPLKQHGATVDVQLSSSDALNEKKGPAAANPFAYFTYTW